MLFQQDDWSQASMQCYERPQRSVCEPQSVGAEADIPPVVNGGQVSSVSSATVIDESEELIPSSAPVGAQEVVSSMAVQSVPIVSHTSSPSSCSPSPNESQAIQITSTVSSHGASVLHMPGETSPSANPIVLCGEPAASTATFSESSALYLLLASSSFSAPLTPPPRSSRSSTAANTLGQLSFADVQQPSHHPASSTASVTSTPGQVSSSAATMPRSTPTSSFARPIAVPPWCRGPMVLDGLQVVPEYRLGLTIEAVWSTMWGVSRHQLQRIWSVRGPDSLLAAIIRSEMFDWDTNHEHPSAAEIAKMRTDLKKFVSSSSEDKYRACFPAGVKHRTKQAMIELLADPKHWLDAELLYVYYAYSRDQYDMRIYLISVDGASERRTEFGEELANNETSCTIIYENLAEQPAHYEAVSCRTAKGRISLKPTRPFSEFAKILKQASRELSHDRSATLKRKATQPPSGLDTQPKRSQHEKGEGERDEGGADDQQNNVDAAAGGRPMEGRPMEIE